MWKIFAIIAAVALVAAGLLGWQNKSALDRETRLRLAAETKRDDAKKQIADKQGELKKVQDELVVVKQAPVTLGAELTKVEASISEQEKKEGELGGQLDEIITKIAAAKDLVDSLGPIEGIDREMKKLAEDQKAAEEDYNAAKNGLALAEGRVKNLQSRIASYQEIERGQMTAVTPAHLRTTVESANNQWGFVVLNAGERQGLVTNSELAVARGGYQICKLQVTSLEPNRSVASIMPGTLPSGYYVVPGDVVVVVPKEAPAPGAES